MSLSNFLLVGGVWNLFAGGVFLVLCACLVWGLVGVLTGNAGVLGSVGKEFGMRTLVLPVAMTGIYLALLLIAFLMDVFVWIVTL